VSVPGNRAFTKNDGKRHVRNPFDVPVTRKYAVFTYDRLPSGNLALRLRRLSLWDIPGLTTNSTRARPRPATTTPPLPIGPSLKVGTVWASVRAFER
jgi:hypothetical protein